jgi:predicted dinucleotide-binding enzyme
MAAAATAFAEGVESAANQEVDDLRLGIVGAGKFGTTLARAAIAAGYDVAISGSGPADDIALTVDVLAAGAHAATTEEVVRHADIIVLAVPTHRFRELPDDLFAGKILVSVEKSIIAVRFFPRLRHKHNLVDFVRLSEW